MPADTLTAEDLHRQGDADYVAGRYENALESFRRAAELAPDQPILPFNMGACLRLLGRPEEELAAYDRALAIAPRFPMAQNNRAACLLLLGDYRGGFQALEWRKSCPGFDDPRYKLPRQWAGEPLAGKTLFVYPEFYQGDLLQFGRYVTLAAGAGAEVTLAAPRPMHRLLQTLSARLRLIDEDAAADGYDFASALLSLPGAFGTTFDRVPHGRYLHAEPERVARWRARIGLEGFRVGIAWQGSAANAAPPIVRAFPLTAAAPLAQVPGVRLISLQKGPGTEQLAGLPAGMTVETLGEDFDPGPDLYLDTAAAMAACDLVIAMDGSVAHLAGALGARSWLAIPKIADWRWARAGAQTPWYPSARLYRQTVSGEWGDVFAAMAQDLRVAAGTA